MIKRKLSALLLALVFVLQIPGAVFAADPEPTLYEDRTVARAVSAYGLEEDGKLYAFLEEDGRYDFSKTSVTLTSNAVSSESDSPLRKVSDNKTTNVHYMFLIDNSGSMSQYRKIVGSYINAIEEAETQEAYYTVATFNDRFKVVKERMTDVEQVKKTISGLSYRGYTDPYTGVTEAIDYLDTYARTSGDVISLIVITDGKPCLRKPSMERELADAAALDIQNSPEVILSTLCTNRWDGKAEETLTKGTGRHSVVTNRGLAEEEGRKMAEFLDGLYRTVYVLKQTENLPAKFGITLRLNEVYNWNGVKETILDREQPVINNVSMLSAHVGDSEEFAHKAQTEDPTEPDETSEDTEQTDVTEQTDESSDTTTATTESTDATDDTDATETTAGTDESETTAPSQTEEVPGNDTDATTAESSADATEATSDTSAAETTAPEENSVLSGLPSWVVPAAIGAAAFILIATVVIIIVVVTAVKKSKAKNAKANEPDAFIMPKTVAVPPGKTVAVPPPGAGNPDKISRTENPANAGPSGIPVAIDVFSGTFLGKEKRFNLTDKLTIGSAEDCDIRFDPSDMEPLAAKVVFSGGQVYLENIGRGEGNTTVGGLQTQGQNILRSGDVITIGEAEFMLKF